MSRSTATSAQSQGERIKAARRIGMRLGFLVIIVASAAACIFEQSEYKGGGRIDKGATASAASSSAPAPTETPTSTSTPTATASGQDAASILEAASGGD